MPLPVTELLHRPTCSIASEHRYSLAPRAKSTFRSVVSAHELLGNASDQYVEVRIVETGDDIRLDFEYPLARGVIREQLSLRGVGDHLAAARLERSVFDTSGARVRYELTDFGDEVLPLPPATYPEVALPFLLSFQPHDGKERDVFAWINDRMLARVDYRTTGTETLSLPSGTLPAIKCIMYPDFNDWVPLGKIVGKLVHPFVPKYHMWFATEPPHHVLRFEGPYGPPGAPEIVMELV